MIRFKNKFFQLKKDLQIFSMKKLKESPKLIYLGAIPVFIASYLVYKYIKAVLKKDDSQKLQFLQNKPQMLFSKFIRDNLIDNSKDFFTPEHYLSVKKQILNLSMEKISANLSNIHARDFIEDDYVFISTEKELDNFVKNLLKKENVIGIDIEQTNLESYQGYNCLIQIATSEKNFLIDAILLHDVFPYYLKQIFENENIVKVFYSGASDLQWINRDYGLFIINYFDVHEAALLLGGKNDSSLVALFKQYCGYNFDRNKKKEFQTSDWRKRPLTKEQCSYAALDVHYLRYLYSILFKLIIEQKGVSIAEKFLMKLQQNCLKTYQLKAFVPKTFSDYFYQKYKGKDRDHLKNKFILFCQFIDEKARKLDLNFEKVCSKENCYDLIIHFYQNNVSNANIHAFLQQRSEGYYHIISDVEKIKDIMSSTSDYLHEEVKEDDSIVAKNNAKSQRKKLFEESTKSAKPYDNCQILGSDGEHLSTTNKAKAQWYLKKQLAILVQEDPIIVKLKFKPSGNNKPEVFEATTQEGEKLDFVRKNQCVVCGQEESLTKYHLVPSNYRQHFPLKLKEHRALDIVLLCLRCLDKANKESHKFKQTVAQKYDVPLTEKSETKKARALLSDIQRNTKIYVDNKNIIPPLQLERLINTIKKSCDSLVNDFELSDEIKLIFGSFSSDEEGKIIPTEQFINFLKNQKDLKKIINDSSDTKDLKNLHGKILVEKLATLQNIQEFIHEWRLHFVSSLDPHFLPKDLQLIIQTRNLELKNL